MSKRKATSTRAIPFVTENGGELRVNADARDFLGTVDPPFGVVVVAGIYRSGKSFLLNRGVLHVHGAGVGFDTGNSINACTKGIWIYPEVVEDEGRRLIVLDSEGTRSLTASSDADSKLVSLSMLLASVFVYNSTGSLDESALSALGVFAAVAKSVLAGDSRSGGCEYGGEDGLAAQVATKSPELIWVLRDFHLEVQTEAGKPMTADEYLEVALHSKEDDQLRVTLRSQFPSRTLCPLVRPVDKETELAKLGTLPDSKLRPEFLSQLAAFRRTLFLRAPVKCVGNSPLGGKVYLEICEHLCRRMNEGHTPTVLDTYGFMIENQVLGFSLEAAKAADGAQEKLSAAIPVPPPKLHDQVVAALSGLEPERLATPDAVDRAKTILASHISSLTSRLSSKNDDACMKWIRRAKVECERTDDPVPFFREHLEQARATVGEGLTLNTLPLFIDIVFERIAAKEKRSSEEASKSKAESARAESKLEKAEKECATLRKDLESEILKTGSSGNLAREEYDLMEAQLAGKTQRIAQLESEIEAERSRAHSLATIEAASKEAAGGTTTGEDPAAACETLERVHALTFKLRDAEERRESVAEQLAASENERKEELERSVRGLRESAMSAERAHCLVAAQLGAEIEESRAKLTAVKEELSAAMASLAEKADELTSSRAKLGELEKRHDDETDRARNEAMEKFRAGVSSVSAGVEDVRRELTETRGRALAAECARAQSEGAAANLKRRLVDADAEVAQLKKLRADLDTAKRSNTELAVSNKSLETLAEDLRARARGLESSNRELQKDISASDRKHAVEIARLEIMLSGHCATASAPNSSCGARGA